VFGESILALLPDTASQFGYSNHDLNI